MDALIALLELQFVLSGFALHLASHFARSSLNHSYRYASSNDQPNCIASYSAKPDPWCNMRVSKQKFGSGTISAPVRYEQRVRRVAHPFPFLKTELF